MQLPTFPCHCCLLVMPCVWWMCMVAGCVWLLDVQTGWVWYWTCMLDRHCAGWACWMGVVLDRVWTWVVLSRLPGTKCTIVVLAWSPPHHPILAAASSWLSSCHHRLWPCCSIHWQHWCLVAIAVADVAMSCLAPCDGHGGHGMWVQDVGAGCGCRLDLDEAWYWMGWVLDMGHRVLDVLSSSSPCSHSYPIFPVTSSSLLCHYHHVINAVMALLLLLLSHGIGDGSH